ncbi:hypothetical protein QWZ18_03920 [Methylobacterium longum]|nr:hypothetical protein [Methylobacterium longum]MDN3569774.1 hypothetical protein [Methylobacterium longum]
MAAFREPLDDVRADGVPVVGYAVRDGALVGRDRPGVPAAAGLDLLDADRTERGQGTILGCLGLRIRTDGGFPAPAGLVLIPEREPVPAWQQCRAGVPCAIRGQRGAGEDRSGLSDDIHREGQDRGSREIGPSVPPSSEPSMAAGGDTRRFVRGRGGEDAREPAPEPLEARSVGHHPQPIRSRVMANPGLPEPTPGDLPPPPPTPEEEPDIGPTGPRTPYPVNDPGIGEPGGPGSEPDIFPGTPTDPGTRM